MNLGSRLYFTFLGDGMKIIILTILLVLPLAANASGSSGEVKPPLADIIHNILVISGGQQVDHN